MKERNELVLIGPPGCGKTTLAYRLSQQVRCRVLNVDALAPTLWPGLGMDREHAEALHQAGRVREWLEYMRPFDQMVLEIALSTFEGCVFDTGAGQVLGRLGCAPREDLSHLPDSLAALLRSFRHIVRVRVGLDLQQETQVCAQRLARRLQRAKEPCPQRTAGLLARYFAEQADHFKVLGQEVVHTGGQSSRLVARQLAAWRQAVAGLP